MAKVNTRKSKSSEGFFTALSRKCSSFAGLLVFVMLSLNLVVVYLFERSRSPQVVYSVERVFVNTNSCDLVSVPVPAFDGVSTNVVARANDPLAAPLVRVTTEYEYFTYGYSRLVRMFDRFFSEGSLTSYGRIVTIFPDRILLDDGSYINNQKWMASQPQQVVSKQ